MPAWASVEYGPWYARSAEFLHSPGMNQLRWLRMIGDTIFALGAVVLGWLSIGLGPATPMTSKVTWRKANGKCAHKRRTHVGKADGRGADPTPLSNR
jgi:hypothetical protein